MCCMSVTCAHEYLSVCKISLTLVCGRVYECVYNVSVWIVCMSVWVFSSLVCLTVYGWLCVWSPSFGCLFVCTWVCVRSRSLVILKVLKWQRFKSILPPPSPLSHLPALPFTARLRTSLCHVSCWLCCCYHQLFGWLLWLAWFLFSFALPVVTHSFTFCLNFVCLSFSLLACSLSVHAVVLTVSAAHSLLPLAPTKCQPLWTCGECLPPLAPSPCEYQALFSSGASGRTFLLHRSTASEWINVGSLHYCGFHPLFDISWNSDTSWVVYLSPPSP